MQKLVRLTQLTSLSRVRLLHSVLISRGIRIDGIKTGGGGNPDIKCLEMCQELLEVMETGVEDFSWAVESLRA